MNIYIYAYNCLFEYTLVIVIVFVVFYCVPNSSICGSTCGFIILLI